MERKTILSLFTSLAFFAGLTACSAQPEGHEPAPGNDDETPQAGCADGVGGAMGHTDPPVEPAPIVDMCEGEPVVRQAYLCAGQAPESRAVSQRSVALVPHSPTSACDTLGTNLVEGKGALTSLPQSYGGAGGAGGAAGGSNSGDLEGELDPWCEEAPEGTALAGVSYSVNDCGGSELRLPVRFREPQGWYRLRAYSGETPCERNQLLGEFAGTGTGEVSELDIAPPSGTFVSLELVVDQEVYSSYYGHEYSYPTPNALTLELEQVEANSP